MQIYPHPRQGTTSPKQGTKVQCWHTRTSTLTYIFPQSGRVEGIVTDTYPYFENYSRSYCQEKEIINYKFRNFINAYARAISSDYIELSILSTLI